MRKKGYIHLYTGDGKGKTTAALGLAHEHITKSASVVGPAPKVLGRIQIGHGQGGNLLAILQGIKCGGERL